MFVLIKRDILSFNVHNSKIIGYSYNVFELANYVDNLEFKNSDTLVVKSIGEWIGEWEEGVKRIKFLEFKQGKYAKWYDYEIEYYIEKIMLIK